MEDDATSSVRSCTHVSSYDHYPSTVKSHQAQVSVIVCVPKAHTLSHLVVHRKLPKLWNSRFEIILSLITYPHPLSFTCSY